MNEDIDLRQQAAKGLTFSILEQFAQRGVSVLVLILLARLLQPHDFGVVALATGITVFMAIVLERGFPQAILQRKEIDDAHISTAYWANIGLGIVFMILGIALSEWLSRILQEPFFALIFRVVSIGIFLEALSGVPRALLHRELKFRLLARHALIAAVLSGIVGVGMAWQGFGAWSLVAQILVERSIRLLLLQQATSWVPEIHFSLPHFAELKSFALNTVGSSITEYAGLRAAELFIAVYLGLTALGYYVLANKIILTIGQFLIVAVPRIGVSVFSRIQQDTPRVKKALHEAVRLSSMILLPVYVGIMITAPQLVPLVFGTKWIPSVPILQLLSCMGVFLSLSSWNNIVLLALGKPKVLFKIYLTTTVAVLIALTGSVSFGLLAIACVQVLRSILLWAITLLALKKHIVNTFPEYIRQLTPSVGPACCMTVVILFLQQGILSGETWFALIAMVVIGVLAYVVSLFLLSPELVKETVATIKKLRTR